MFSLHFYAYMMYSYQKSNSDIRQTENRPIYLPGDEGWFL